MEALGEIVGGEGGLVGDHQEAPHSASHAGLGEHVEHLPHLLGEALFGGQLEIL